ncbi:MAG: hypothetical protein CVU90_11255 [Firmicutes bacterium HGW-Firmicutes-15]|nr:MAG: hypothetical protein CVU90_11255 [Firmicutes bacterium HGW-Firmicutes-15]
MERLTRVLGNNDFYIVDNLTVNHDLNGYTGEAITRLAKFENIYEDLIASQIQIPKELEKLRNEGKTKTVRFRELMVNKMTNANIINLFKTYGLE